MVKIGLFLLPYNVEKIRLSALCTFAGTVPQLLQTDNKNIAQQAALSFLKDMQDDYAAYLGRYARAEHANLCRSRLTSKAFTSAWQAYRALKDGLFFEAHYEDYRRLKKILCLDV